MVTVLFQYLSSRPASPICVNVWKVVVRMLPEVIDSRIAKAEFELGFIPHFDVCIVNDDLATAQAEAVEVIKDFLSKE